LSLGATTPPPTTGNQRHHRRRRPYHWTVRQEGAKVTLAHRLLGQPARLRLATTFRLFSDGLPQRRLQGSLVAGLHKVANANTEALRQEPERLERRISHAPLQLGKQSWCDHVVRSLNLCEPLEPPSPPYIGSDEFSKSAEIHETS